MYITPFDGTTVFTPVFSLSGLFFRSYNYFNIGPLHLAGGKINGSNNKPDFNRCPRERVYVGDKRRSGWVVASRFAGSEVEQGKITVDPLEAVSAGEARAALGRPRPLRWALRADWPRPASLPIGGRSRWSNLRATV